MKLTALIALMMAAAFALPGCNTWSGVKQDAKAAGHATGEGLEKAGEKIKEIAK
jgi:predicted small secreted protein